MRLLLAALMDFGGRWPLVGGLLVLARLDPLRRVLSVLGLATAR